MQVAWFTSVLISSLIKMGDNDTHFLGLERWLKLYYVPNA